MTNETPPHLDEALVQRLAELANELDGADEHDAKPLLEEFNELAGTSIPFAEFQGIYGAEDHIDYVRRVLTDKLTNADSSLTRDDLTEMFKRVCENPTDDAYLQFMFSTIKKTFGDHQISDLVFWPGEYFGDGDNSREQTPEEMAEAVLERYRQKQA
ncbi:hypothetical protein [Gimesia aquarii]|uniref:Uncharacterized protein n=1 Tax=Gimesia aquarii TaxID=2527964 RepID=A0A517X0N3_9PLAN|nr:hypothetical protein [Gimesia aquarii]QDU11059.1 hypothetical protein V202x_44750 [Gimesia aquarii]